MSKWNRGNFLFSILKFLSTTQPLPRERPLGSGRFLSLLAVLYDEAQFNNKILKHYPDSRKKQTARNDRPPALPDFGILEASSLKTYALNCIPSWYQEIRWSIICWDKQILWPFLWTTPLYVRVHGGPLWAHHYFAKWSTWRFNGGNAQRRQTIKKQPFLRS